MKKTTDKAAAEDEQLERALEDGWDALERGDLDVAEKLAREAAALAPESAEAMLLQAACKRETGSVDEAIAILRRTVGAATDWSTPELWLAELLAIEPETTAEALRHATRALSLADEEDEYLDALALKAGLEAELGEIDDARRTLEALPPADVALGDPVVALEIAEIYLAVGDPAAARLRLETLTSSTPDMADAWYALGAACEELGDDRGMRDAWVKTRDLDAAAPAEDGANGLPLSETELVAVAEQALAELPARARQLLENVPIVLADTPAKSDVVSGLDPRALGLFQGTPYPETSNLGGQPGLTQIVLFRRSLGRVATSEDELRDEIRVTLLHETGHFFGMSEADLENVGLD